jgi:hypothetical protein
MRLNGNTVHHRVHNSSPQDPILSQKNPIQTLQPYFIKNLLTLPSRLWLDLTSFLSFRLPKQNSARTSHLPSEFYVAGRKYATISTPLNVPDITRNCVFATYKNVWHTTVGVLMTNLHIKLHAGNSYDAWLTVFELNAKWLDFEQLTYLHSKNKTKHIVKRPTVAELQITAKLVLLLVGK